MLLFQRHAFKPVLYSIVGRSGLLEARKLDVSDIRYRDIDYQVESADAYTKQAQRDTFMQLVQQGFILSDHGLDHRTLTLRQQRQRGRPVWKKIQPSHANRRLRTTHGEQAFRKFLWQSWVRKIQRLAGIVPQSK